MKYEKYSRVKFASFVHIRILRPKTPTAFASNVTGFPVRNTNAYKIRKLHKAIFSVFYNTSPLNFANYTNLRTLFLAVVRDFVYFVWFKI